jgi:hypothetical protein
VGSSDGAAGASVELPVGSGVEGATVGSVVGAAVSVGSTGRPVGSAEGSIGSSALAEAVGEGEGTPEVDGSGLPVMTGSATGSVLPGGSVTSGGLVAVATGTGTGLIRVLVGRACGWADIIVPATLGVGSGGGELGALDERTARGVLTANWGELSETGVALGRGVPGVWLRIGVHVVEVVGSCPATTLGGWGGGGAAWVVPT